MTSGKTLQCFQRILAELPWEPKSTEREKQEARRIFIREVAPKIGVTADTMRRWNRGSQKPRGLPLIRLRYLVDDYGERPAELNTLDPEARSLGAIVARFSADHEMIAQYLGIMPPSRLFAILHGKRRLSEPQRVLAEKLVSEFLAREL